MEDLLIHLDEIKQNILKINKETQEQSKYFLNNFISKDIMYNNMNKRASNNYQKKLILSRQSMINIRENIKSINMSHKYYLLEESSDNEDGYNEETKQIIPSLRKVAKNIFDPNLIMILTDIKYFPKEAQPGLIITGIEDWVTEKHIKYFLKGVPSFKDRYKRDKNDNNNNINRNNEENNLDIDSVTIFAQLNKRYAYVKLNDFNQMEVIVSFFLNPIKKEYPSYNSKKEKMEVYYAYDLLKLTKNHWYGVILRNLPPNCNDRSIYKFTDQKVKNGIKYCLNPILVDGLYCALVVCKELEFAEKLCNDLNNTEINNLYMKAHLHPEICKIRNNDALTDYETFNNDGYIFTEEAEDSEKCLSHAKNFMEFFCMDYLINNFSNSNHIKIKKKEEENKNLSEKNKEKEKNIIKKKDLDLASSILDFIKSKSIEDLKKNSNNNNNQNLKVNSEINNNSKEISTNNNNPENPSNAQLPLINNNLKSSLFMDKDSSMNLEINKSNSNIILNQENKIKENEKDNNNEINKADEITKVIYSEEQIKYYTYNMENEKYYEEKEINEHRKRSPYNYQRNNFTYRESNFRNNNKDNFNNKGYSKDYNKDNYRSYKRNEHNNIYNNSSPRHYPNTSYKKSNLNNYISSFKDKDYRNYNEYNNNNNRGRYDNYDNKKERSKENNKERSREQSYDKESSSYKNKENREKDREKKFYNNYNKDNRDNKDYINRRDNRNIRDNRDKEKEWDKDKYRIREDNFRERNKERYSYDRNRRFNENKYDNRYENKYENRYDNYNNTNRHNINYDRNNVSDFNSKRKDSYHDSGSRQRDNNINDRNDRNDREKREIIIRIIIINEIRIRIIFKTFYFMQIITLILILKKS